MSKEIWNNISEGAERYGRRFSYGSESKKSDKNMSMRDMLGIMRTALHENTADQPRAINQAEIDREQEKMSNYFADDNVNIQYQSFEVRNDGVFLSGSIDGQLLFAYKVTPIEADSGVEVEYMDGFDPSDPDNDKIIKKVQAYYNDFYKYWRDNELNMSGN